MQYQLIILILSAFLAPLVAAQPVQQDESALIHAGKWSPQFTIGGLSGEDGFAPVVYDFAQQDDGSIVAAGRFHWFGKQAVGPLARLEGDDWRSATDEWSQQAPEIGFSAIAIREDGVTALSTNSGPFGAMPVEIWLANGGEIQVVAQLQGAVRSLAWFNGDLWAAGFFSMPESGTTHLAVWDGTTWSAPPGGPANQVVYRLTESGNSLLLAGDFTSVGGIPARGIAEWDGQNWTAYDLEPSIGIAHVYTVARTASGDLYAGGAITGGLLRWNGSSWETLDGGVFSGEFGGVVSDIALLNGDVYVTGCFSHLTAPESDPSAIPALSVARWDGSQWESLDDGSVPIGTSWFEYGVCGGEPNQFTAWDMRYQRLYSDGDRVFLGGMMPGAGGVPSQSVVSYDGFEWSGYGETDEGLFGASQVVTTGGPEDTTYIMGGVTHAGDAQSEAGIYRYEDGWEAVEAPRFPEGLVCSDFAVNRAADVLVGCHEPPALEQNARPVVLRLDAEQWVPMSGLDVEGSIWDMRADDAGRVWIAGGVRAGDAGGSGFVSRVEANQLTVVEDGFNSMVFRVSFPPQDSNNSEEFLAGGAFTQIDGGSFSRIAQWTDGQWQPLGTGLDTAVLAMAWGEDAVFVSTEAPSEPAPGVERVLLGRWNGSQWIEIGTPDNGLPAPREETEHNFSDLLAVGKYLIAVGSVWPETGGRNAFVYDGNRIEPLAGGLDAINVSSVALAGDGLWFAGEIAEAGSGGLQPEPPDSMNHESKYGEISSVGVARFEKRGRPRFPPYPRRR